MVAIIHLFPLVGFEVSGQCIVIALMFRKHLKGNSSGTSRQTDRSVWVETPGLSPRRLQLPTVDCSLLAVGL